MSEFLHLTPAFTFDAMQEAEDIGGSVSQALAMQILNSNKRRVLAVDNADTLFSETMSRYEVIAKRIGFEELARFSFLRKDYQQQEEVYIVYKHPQSHAILCVESFGASVNKAKMYFVFSRRTVNIFMHQLGGSWESASQPDWRVCSDIGEFPELPNDALYNADWDVRECLVSKHSAILQMDPVVRPQSPRFELDSAFICSNDYVVLDRLPWNKRIEALDSLNVSRMNTFDTIKPADFGFSD